MNTDIRTVYLTLRRQTSTTSHTMGALYVDGSFFCHTLERAIGDNKKLEAIPAGSYAVKLRRMPSKPRWGLLPLLIDVPDREGIFIHIGNYVSDSSGCILLGMGANEDSLSFSSDAVSQLVSILQGCNCNITIEDCFNG